MFVSVESSNYSFKTEKKIYVLILTIVYFSVIYIFIFDLTRLYFRYQQVDSDAEIIGQYDVKHIMTLPINNNVSFGYYDFHYQ